ncbi:replication protein A 70 kDa dna-binding subunit, partial [Trifolium medium]|nr:replication protein A 70 kDa dna-binding subunit [Trifolium medium]
MSEKAEGTTINSVINKTGLGSLETGHVMPPVYGTPANQV